MSAEQWASIFLAALVTLIILTMGIDIATTRARDD